MALIASACEGQSKMVISPVPLLHAFCNPEGKHEAKFIFVGLVFSQKFRSGQQEQVGTLIALLFCRVMQFVHLPHSAERGGGIGVQSTI